MTARVRRGAVVAAMVVACALGALVPLALARPVGASNVDCARVRAERDGYRERARRAIRANQRMRRQQVQARAADQRRLDEAQRALDEAKAALAKEQERLRRLEQVIGKVIDPGLP